MTDNNHMNNSTWYCFLSLTLTTIVFYVIVPFALKIINNDSTLEINSNNFEWGYIASILIISLIGACYICYQAITEEICYKNIWVRK